MVVLDYGIGNVNSIINMFKKIGIIATLTNDIEVIRNADKLVLPGVGAYDYGMLKLEQSGLVDVIMKHAVVEQKPLLGICLGMQMLGRKSEEGNVEGLDLIPFDCKRFEFDDNPHYKTPHMGWNLTRAAHMADPLTDGLSPVQRYYYVHSYYAICDSEDNVLMRCEYGIDFAAAVKKGNIYGVQFHPEKSHQFGMALLDNFARRV